MTTRMTSGSPAARSFTTLAAIIVAGIVIAASVFFAFGTTTVTRTIPETTTQTTTLTDISTSTAAPVTMTTTVYSVMTLQTTTNTSTTCTATGGIGCLHFIDRNWTISVSYSGPWGVNYQGWLGDQSSGQLVVSGSFFGDSPGNRTINVAGWSDEGTTVCAQAQKLDSSNSTLVVSILPPNVTNQTSAAHGSTETCIAYLIQ